MASIDEAQSTPPHSAGQSPQQEQKPQTVKRKIIPDGQNPAKFEGSSMEFKVENKRCKIEMEDLITDQRNSKIKIEELNAENLKLKSKLQSLKLNKQLIRYKEKEAENKNCEKERQELITMILTLLNEKEKFFAFKNYAMDRIKQCNNGKCRTNEESSFQKQLREACYGCNRDKALMDKLEGERSWVKVSDFSALNEELKKSGGIISNVPSYLEYVARRIGRNIAPAHTICSHNMLLLPCILFYAAIDEMHHMKLQDIDDNVILKWGFVIKDAQRMNLDVQFAMTHLRMISHAYFISKAGRVQKPEFQSNYYKLGGTMFEVTKRFQEIRQIQLGTKLPKFCVLETECFNDGQPLSKGILRPFLQPCQNWGLFPPY